MDDDRVTLEIEGEELVLLPERAVLWPAESLLLVADVHLGRIDALRSQGAEIPGDTLGEMLGRLRELVERFDPDRLVVLGDLVEGPEGLPEGSVERVGRAFASWSSRLELVPGNHDRGPRAIPAEWPVVRRSSALEVGPFLLRHEPAASDRGYVLAGHYHPTAHLAAAGDELCVPCFAFGDDVGVLPALHPVTNGVRVSGRSYRRFALADGEVIPLDEESPPSATS